jgi:PAS domain S-box-containing protein
MAVKLGDMRRSVAATAEPGAVRTEADNLLKQVNGLRALATNSRQRRQLDRLESEILAPSRNGGNVASIRARLHDLELAEYRKLENFADQSKTISERAFALMPFTTVLSLILVMRGLFWLNGEMAARQRGADALRQSEAGERARRAELETLMDAIPVAVFIGQGVGCQTMTSNRAGVELLRVKYGPDGQPAHERSDLKARVGGKVLQDNVLPMQLAASSGRPIMGAEFQIAFPDGEKREFFGNALPLFDDSGAVRGGISAYMDITARKRRELNNSFLQQMQAAIATASSGAEILRIASERMVEHFQLEQCLFAQVDGIREEAAVLHDCHVDGTTRLSGVYRIRDNHTEEEIRKMSSGETVVAGAMAIANHLKRGDWQLLLRALRSGSGAWADEDTRLLGELAERIYMQLERARAEKKLRESEARFRSIFNDASVPMCVATPDGRYTQANPAFCELTGYTHDELLTMTALEITHPDDRVTVGFEPLKKLVDGTIASFRDEKRYLRKDGSVIWADINVSVVRDSENQPTFLIVQIQDITGPRKAAEELSKSEELRTLAIEAGQLGIWRWDNTTHELVWSERCNVMTGQPPNAEISHVSVMGLIHPEERARVHAEAVDALINKKDIELEYRTVWPDGTIRWVQARGKSFDDENGELLRIIGIMQDVTERRKSEEALRKFNTELESLVQERTEVIQRTMLELREEIAKRRGLEEEILGISERAHARIGQDLHDDLGQQLVGIALHLQLLSAQLNAEAHPSAQEASKLKGFLVDSIVTTRNLAKSLYPVELERGGLIISLQDLAQRTELMSRAVCTVTADEAFRFDKAAEIHLYRIVQESIGNALKHGKAQHIAIDCGVRDGVSTLTVTDDGVGFETRGDGKIWGMGLHLFQYRARLIGANISVTRGENGGCVVTCTMGSPAVVA